MLVGVLKSRFCLTDLSCESAVNSALRLSFKVCQLRSTFVMTEVTPVDKVSLALPTPH
jgi:hypothetical protein